MPLILTASCATCRHYDGDHHCALPVALQVSTQFMTRIYLRPLLSGYISHPDQVVCAKHDEKMDDEAKS